MSVSSITPNNPVMLEKLTERDIVTMIVNAISLGLIKRCACTKCSVSDFKKTCELKLFYEWKRHFSQFSNIEATI